MLRPVVPARTGQPRLWILIANGRLSEDRAYVLGHLKSRFADVEVTRVARDAAAVPRPSRRPGVILNLIGAWRKSLLDDVDRTGVEFGAPVYQSGAATWRATDKRTYLRDYGDAAPASRIARGPVDVEAARLALGGDVVVKDPFGGHGVGIARLRSPADLPIVARILAEARTDCGDLIVQRYLEGLVENEHRVVVGRTPGGGHEIIAAFRRRAAPGSVCGNVSQGGGVAPAELTDAARAFALDMARRSDLDATALDIAEHGGRFWFIEHNVSFGGIIDHDLMHGIANVARIGDAIEALAVGGRDAA